jgi:hypothetical protein
LVPGAIDGGLLAENASQRHLETRQQQRGQDVTAFARQLAGPAESIRLATVDANDVRLGIDNPVLMAKTAL